MPVAIYLFSAFVLLCASYVVLRVLFGYDYRVKGRLSPLSILTGTLIFFLWGGFPYIYGPSNWPARQDGAIFGLIGWLCLILGLLIIIVGIATLGFRTALGQPAQALKQAGLYRFCRNPQIVGCFLYAVGFALLWPSWYAFGWVILFAGVAHIMVITEEQHLRRVFGDAYIQYCRRVPRYFFFWKVFRRSRGKNEIKRSSL
jgi:protein-S-isoprenylcysteine O-methyltransferase Ste14